jgi:NTP pyrophosphatase (non-canonical NTP hydrolase)
MFNRLTSAEQEMFFILSEECGEIVRAVGKILRHGLKSEHPRLPGIDNFHQLISECGDLMCMFDMLERQYPGFLHAVENAKVDKIYKIREQKISCLHHVEPL